MHRLFAFLLVFLNGFSALAQLTLRVTSVPANTPPADPIFVAGTFNGWNPAAAGWQLTRTGSVYSITFPTSVRGAIEFKFTRGSWPMGETTASGTSLPNRTYTVPATGAATLDVQVAGWDDLIANPPPTSTASPSVSVMSPAFPMPQLGRTRRIWLYLPPDYATTQKTYPVLYMHDGQNLFDAALAFGGNEWGVDEALDRLQAAGDWGCIVVGIENGPNRLDEYSPYVNPQYGGGQGDQYVDFIANSLKPYVDQHYRTRPDRLHTGLMGSSMGGLISLYAALKRPDVFGRAGVLSPSLWFNRRIYTYARQAPPLRPDPRVFLLSGARESSTQLRDQRQMTDTLAAAGFLIGSEVDTVVKADGQHAEWFWKREFPAAYQWLFAGVGPNGLPDDVARFSFDLFPNPVGRSDDSILTIQTTADAPEAGRVQVLDAQGRVLLTTRLRHGRAQLDVRRLAAGVYRIRVADKRVAAVRGWVKE